MGLEERTVKGDRIMKLLLPIMMLFLGAPLVAQTRLLIDNTTDHEVDTRRIGRLTEEALATAGDNAPTIILHIWPRTTLQSVTGQTMESFFVSPNHVYMHDMDYLAFVQGALLATFPDAAVTELAREGRRIWLEESLVLRLDEITTRVAGGPE